MRNQEHTTLPDTVSEPRQGPRENGQKELKTSVTYAVVLSRAGPDYVTRGRSSISMQLASSMG